MLREDRAQWAKVWGATHGPDASHITQEPSVQEPAEAAARRQERGLAPPRTVEALDKSYRSFAASIQAQCGWHPRHFLLLNAPLKQAFVRLLVLIEENDQWQWPKSQWFVEVNLIIHTRRPVGRFPALFRVGVAARAGVPPRVD